MPLKVFTLNSFYIFTSVKDIFARYIMAELREAPYSLSWITKHSQIDIISCPSLRSWWASSSRSPRSHSPSFLTACWQGTLYSTLTISDWSDLGLKFSSLKANLINISTFNLLEKSGIRISLHLFINVWIQLYLYPRAKSHISLPPFTMKYRWRGGGPPQAYSTPCIWSTRLSSYSKKYFDTQDRVLLDIPFLKWSTIIFKRTVNVCH